MAVDHPCRTPRKPLAHPYRGQSVWHVMPCLAGGLFAESNTADRGMHNTLLNVVRAGLIRQLPNGNFAPATVLDTIRLRRAM